MKTILLFIVVALCHTFTFSQNDLVVFSEDGHAFTLYVNGAQVNDIPASRVKAVDIRNEIASCRIVFADDLAPEIKQNITFFEKDTQTTSRIIKTKKGYKLRMFGQGPRELDDAMTEEVIEVPEPMYEAVEVIEAEEVQSSSTHSALSSTTTTVVETTVVETVDEGNGERVKMDIDVMGVKMGMDVQVDDTGVSMGSDMGTSTRTTTTTTATTVVDGSESPDVEVEIEEDDFMETESNRDVVVVHTDDNAPCHPPMGDISTVRRAMQAEGFDDDKMAVGKQVLRSACLETVQVKSLARLFGFEDDKLEFVKYCYERTSDQENYFDLFSIFDFSDSKEALNKFLETR